MLRNVGMGPIGGQPMLQNVQNQPAQQGGHLAQGAQGQIVQPGYVSSAWSFASSLASGTLNLTGSLLGATARGVVAGGQLAGSALVAGGQLASSALVTGGQLAVTAGGALKDGAVAVGGAVKDGAVAVGGAVKDSAVAVGGAVKDSAVAVGGAVKDSAVAVGGAVKDGAVAVGGAVPGLATKGFEKIGGTAMYLGAEMLRGATERNIGPLLQPGEVERMTLFGSLPNVPGFGAAIAAKGAQLDANFNHVSGTAAPHVQNVLNALDQALTTAGQIEQGGQATALTPRDFHAALLLGAHFVKEDGGALYNQLRQTQDGGGADAFTARSSSHYKGVPDQQYGMDLPGGMGHLLIGKTDTGDTFFQLESHGVGNPNQSKWEKISDTIGHTQAYMQHISGDAHYVQIGPQGCISASEKDGQHIVLS